MASSASSENGDLGFQIAPMIDVVFVLLLFFMATMGARTHKIFLPADIPGTVPTLATVPVAVTIDIAADGQVLMNNQVMGQPGDKKLAELRSWFIAAHERFGKKDPVTLHPSAETRQERVMDVLNACVAAGVPNVSFR